MLRIKIGFGTNGGFTLQKNKKNFEGFGGFGGLGANNRFDSTKEFKKMLRKKILVWV